MRFVTVAFCLWLGCNAARGEGPAEPDAGRTAINLEALSRLKGINLDANPALKTVVSNVLNQVRGTAQFVDVVRDFGIKGQEETLLEFAVKDPSSAAATEAMRLVLREENSAALKHALDGTNATRLIEALGNTGEKEIAPLLVPGLTDLTKSLDARKKALQALVKVQDGAAAVLDLAKVNRLPEDLRATAAMELNSVRWESLKTQAALILPLPKTKNAVALPPIRELVKLGGDPNKGAAVFKRETVGCLKCHQVNGEGVDFGPNLSEIGTKLAKDAIYESILDPSAGISFGYEAWNLELTDGDDALGLIVSETADEIALKRVGGMVTRYQKSDISRRTKQKLSIMPAGLEQTMTVEDLVDLVEFLSRLKKTGP